ncbi:MAG TPA: YqeG family HAD IIIA-type phosphatase, partial [Candidatus Atribacteria bacterium]|nr:YqeG family HAD IIIA-type phosphatase [Candidatus Atribacteria bacterium]
MRSILKVSWDSNLPIYKISQAELQKKGINSL